MSNGQRPARTAQDVAQLEADNEYLHNENERLTRELAVVTADRSRLQIENSLLDARSRENLLRATRMETIVNVHSAGLVAAMQEIARERTTERAVRRQFQEEQLTEETGPAPTFLTRGTERTRPRDYEEQEQVVEAEGGYDSDPSAARYGVQVQPETRRESDEDRNDRLRGAAERIRTLPAPSSMRPGRIDPDLAARDSRLPPMGDYPRDPIQTPTRETDDAALARLAGRIESRTTR